MATKTTTTTTDTKDLLKKIKEVRLQLWDTRLNVKAGKEKNTNAHLPYKKQLAQLLTKLHNN